ncbi:hypothetical protein SETIT_6G018300v2 [Setaria italica]|uniref:Uncharacterized protein n=1 Tax=Setaria italica TaxID=4555 RepID=A0A368RHF5_SETIT|nr:hypothetical protein SETIT_6G018300v2 [Setaria italica]
MTVWPYRCFSQRYGAGRRLPRGKEATPTYGRRATDGSASGDHAELELLQVSRCSDVVLLASVRHAPPLFVVCPSARASACRSIRIELCLLLPAGSPPAGLPKTVSEKKNTWEGGSKLHRITQLHDTCIAAIIDRP